MIKALRGLSPPAGQQREVGQQRGVSAGWTRVLLLQPRPDALNTNKHPIQDTDRYFNNLFWNQYQKTKSKDFRDLTN